MNDSQDSQRWLRANDEFLSALVRWVRGLLCRRQSLGGGKPSDPIEIDAAGKRMAEAAACVPALESLCRRLGLSAFEKSVLSLCTAVELSGEVADLCGVVQGSASRQFATFSLAMELFEQPCWDALAPQRPLRHWNLIEIVFQSTTALTRQPLQIDERVLNYIKGVNHLDGELASVLREVRLCPADALSPSQRAVVATIGDSLRGVQRLPGNCGLIQLCGPQDDCQRLIASAVCRESGWRLHEISIDSQLSAEDVERFARLLARESLLGRIAFYVELQDQHAMAVSLLRKLRRLGDTPLFAACSERIAALSPDLAVDVEKPTPGEQSTIWQSAVPAMERSTAELLAGQFRLDAPTIQRLAEKCTASVMHEADLWNACRAEVHPRLDALAQRIDAKATWADLVLPSEPLELLKQIANQVRHRHRVLDEWGFRSRMNRGFGTTALFAGESGTGKTMAAEVIANDLRLDLYRIDLSTVVSKYIGETEKNLRKLFDAAEDGGVVLFFDEADALFGKRSEVKDSHDRFANIEVNYLLQRIETYRGLAILATNFKSALDGAFLRRLRFVVQFPFPERSERREIWQRTFPKAAPVSGLNLERLAGLHITGGSIQSIALNAAFAAAGGSEVDMQTVLNSARAELVKMQQPVNIADFRLEPTGARR